MRITPEIISQRKFELIKRDPLAIELDELVREKRRMELSYKQLHRRFPHYDYIEIQEQGLMGILEKEVARKWNITTYPTGKLRKDIPFSWLRIYPPHHSVSDAREYIKEDLLPTIREQLPFEREHFEKHGWIFLSGQGGYVCSINESPDLQKLKWKGTVYIPISRGSIPIIIDPRGLSQKSKIKFLKEVWDIVKKTIQKKKAPNSKKWQPIPALGELPELGFLYSTGEDKFQNYLRWYDLHTQEKISCRLIAHFDKTYKTNPLKATELLEKFKQKKIKWGLSVKGEDKIEKGVTKIYEAIYREDYSQEKVKPEIVGYNCSHHGNACPQTCTYYKKWLNRFNRLMASN
jgi:hypothetical protein